MKPGRELDALVAEKVMGCTVYVEANGEHRCDCPGPNSTGPRPHAGIGLYASLMHYSTDIAAAWEVVEKLRKENWQVNVWTTDVGGPWECYLMGPSHYVAEADTAHHAICLAALRAVGVEVDDG